MKNFLCFLLFFLLSLSLYAEEKRKVVLCADISAGDYAWGNNETYNWRDVDDLWAMIWLLNQEDIEVVAILISYGNAFCDGYVLGDPCPTECPIVEQNANRAREFVALANRDIPVYVGSICEFDESMETPVGTAAVIDMIRELDSVDVLAIGPATDPAYIVRDLNDSGEITKIDQITILMGFFGTWAGDGAFDINGTEVGDANFINDPSAMSWLVEDAPSRPPFRFVPFNTARFGLVTPAMIDSLWQINGPASSRVAFLSEHWQAQWMSVLEEQGFHLWDLVCALCMPGDGVSVETIDIYPEIESVDVEGTSTLTVQLNEEGSTSSNVNGVDVCVTRINSIGSPQLFPEATFTSYPDDVGSPSSFAAISQISFNEILKLDKIATDNRIGTGQFGILENLFALSETIRLSPWFSQFSIQPAPWIYQFDLGFLFLSGEDETNIWMYDDTSQGYFWTANSLYPFLYRDSNQTWYYFIETIDGIRYFQNLSTDQTQTF
ncbi:nucleoside hydrolase [Rubellicoccus peritrichatus]|uniref:Nucleoside hydrolase n=1 Tax=Rubellicoccus peritrichatus TaxID=3080537 RepID=A0AAQ3QUA7_9BACT|nr:nucleoside hydrolase [Puniceicoccus sp. CR14]WOO42211.1 nucleoside hydrolase [Puniceicoccus sp. CR14]